MTTETVALTQPKSRLFLDRQAWKILLVMILLVGFFGISDMVGGGADLQNGETILMHSLTGESWEDLRAEDPQAAHLIEWKFRTDGASLFTVALLDLAICLTGFRRGERWAWVVLWAPPLWMALTVLFTWKAIDHPGYGTPVPIISGSILFLFRVTLLALTYRKFFR